MSPAEMYERHWRCYELREGQVGIRDIARQLGCTPGAVSRWLAAWHGGPPPQPAWDRHGSGGARWLTTSARRQRDAARRAETRDAHSASPLAQQMSKQDPTLRAKQPWEGPSMRTQVHHRLALDAVQVTRGRFAAWTTAALAFAFGLTRANLVDEDRFDSDEECERAAEVVLAAAARRAGCVQGRDGVWSTGR